MRALLERQFSADARQLRSRLIKLWLFFPFLVFGYALLTLPIDELSMISVIIALAFCLPYYFLTVLFYCRVWQTCCVKSTGHLAQIFTAFSTVVIIAGWVFLNSVPHHIHLADGAKDNSPFSRIWYYWDQTSHGYPSPFLRVFVRPLEGYGNYVFDATSLLCNLMFLSFVIYVFLAILSLILKPRVVAKENSAVLRIS
jgi:hypothetical protein